MKVLLVSLMVVAAAVSEPEAPAPPAGWQPSGRLLLVPARLENPPPAEYSPPTAATNTTQSTQSDAESQSEKLLDSGEYYVLLPDGSLQMVKYTTAALAQETPNESQQQPAQFTQPQSQQPARYTQPQAQQPARYTQPQAQQPARYTQPQPQQPAEPFAQFQVEYVQFPQPGSQFAQTKLQYTDNPKSAQVKEDTEDVSGFEANVQYRDVKPISAPIYAYNPTPLVRILKK